MFFYYYVGGISQPSAGIGKGLVQSVHHEVDGATVGVELLQPVFGRSFDLNDVLLNGIGIAASTALCFGLRRWRGKEKPC